MEIMISIIIWTLALYGLIEIIKNIVYICSYTKLRSDGIYFIIAVKNQANSIEAFLRSLMFKIIYGKEEINNIIIVDLNSQDETKKIIEKLQKEYEQIKILNIKDCVELLESIKET